MNDKQKNEMTYQSIITLIKKSGMRIIIFAVIAAVIVGCISGLVLFLSQEEASFQAMIEFNYKGAEEGLDPWGMRLDVNKIKSDNIVTQALLDNNFSEERRAKVKSMIVNNITISGVVPQDVMKKILTIKEIATKTPSQLNDLNELSYVSTSFVVTLKNDKKMNMSSKECINVLNSIIDNYIKAFKGKYGFDEVLGTLIGEQIIGNGYDYIELHSLYEEQINSIIKYLNMLIDSSNTFRSTDTKMSFEDIETRVLSIKNYDLNKLQLYLYEKAVSNGKSSIAPTLFINDKLNYINREIQKTTSLITSTETAITNYQFVYDTRTDANGNVEKTVANGDSYDKLQTDLRNYKKELVNLNSNKDLWSDRLTKITEAQALTAEEKADAIAVIDAMFEEINSKLSMEINYVNQAVDEYIKNEVMKNSVLKTVSATKSVKEKSYLKIFLTIELLTIVIACLAAIFITNEKIKKADRNIYKENQSISE